MTRLKSASVVLTVVFFWMPSGALGEDKIVCPQLEICYCVNSDFEPAVLENVARLRVAIAEERARGKAIAYISVPLSSRGGGVFAVNAEVSQEVKKHLEKKYGENFFWAIAPGAPEWTLPDVGDQSAGGAEYMYMWTEVLAGDKGFAEDFDLVYFVGPSDFARFFGLDGKDEMAKIASYRDQRAQTDPAFRSAISRKEREFLMYYAFRASATYSTGAHDEWNIFERANARRRESSEYGIGGQITVLFDGEAVSMQSIEGAISKGYEGTCEIPPG